MSAFKNQELLPWHPDLWLVLKNLVIRDPTLLHGIKSATEWWKWRSFSCAWLFATPWTIHMEFSRSEYWSGWPFPSSGDFPNPGIEPRSPTLQADSLPVEPQGKPKNTGVGNLSLLQWIFLTQESNQGLLHCRWILYQLSYQGSHTEWWLPLIKYFLHTACSHPPLPAPLLSFRLSA